MAITTNGGAGVTADAVATLSNKTLEAPVINNATFTGQQAGLQVAFNDSIVFEGTTADAYETTLSAGEPTADRTVTLPNATDTLVGKATTDTLTNKTINLSSNTLSGTTAQFNTALSDGDFATLAGSETLTNKTLTTPVISTISNTGTLTLPTTTGTLALTSDITVTSSSTTTLTNKTISLGSNTISGTTAQFNTALSDDDFATLAGTETLTNKTLTAPIVNLSLNAQTGTTYTFVLSDNGKLVTASNASAQTYTIPPNSSVAYATGAQINIIQIGAGQVTIQGGSGVTVASTGATATTPKLRAQYSTATCIKGGSDTWYVVGDIS